MYIRLHSKSIFERMISIALVTTLIATVQSQSCTTNSQCRVDQYCDTSAGTEGTCEYAFCSTGDCSAYQDLPFCDILGYCNPNCTITNDYCLSVYGYTTPCIAETGLCEPATCLNVADFCPEYQICNTQDLSCFFGDCSNSDCSAYPTHPICDYDYCLPDCTTVSGQFCYNFWGPDWAFCESTTGICEQGATCVNTPTFCDSFSLDQVGSFPLKCNTTIEACYIGQCTTNLQCGHLISFNQQYTNPYPEVYCNVTSGNCIHGCAEIESGCDEYYNWYFSEFGGLLSAEVYCDTETDACLQKQCISSTDCDVSAGFDCYAGVCTSTCSSSSECYYYVNYLSYNGSGVECVSPYFESPKFCLPQKPCLSNDDCMRADGKASNRMCSDVGRCELVLCENNDECESAFNNNFASCDLFTDPKICLNNECQIDLDCPDPFDSCLTAAYSSGYVCYKTCDYDNTTTTDNDACNVFGTDSDGYDIECNIDVPGDDEIEYCDIYSVNYTSCIVDGCENGYECNLGALTCDLLPTAAPSTQPTVAIICDPDDKSSKCHAKAAACKKDSGKSVSTYSQIKGGNDDEWCAWCLCMDVPDDNPLEECVYYWLKDNNIHSKWKQLFVHVAFQTYFLETCFPAEQYQNCIWDNVKLNDQVTGCDCDQFTCGDATEGAGRYNVFLVIVVVLVMLSWM